MEELEIKRHSMAHVLAKAVQNIYGKDKVKFTIGPAIDNGLYYDFDIDAQITESDLPKIQKEMQNLIKKGEKFEKSVVSKSEALEMFAGNEYKVELIKALPEGEEISVYSLGADFVDLCRGPHVEHAGKLQSMGFKVAKTSGAYWRGDEKNKMLQRVYVYAFDTKDELAEYIKAKEEAEKRDHNKIGRELGYFTTVDYIGQGLPILLPKGARVIQLLQRWVEDVEAAHGYMLTKTPLMAKSDLYKISGHWYHYRDNMFIMGNPDDEKEECLALRPMTCPFQYQVFLSKQRSYRELPMRLGETSTLFRKESSGEMHGLIRVRQFTISEGHLVLRPDQLAAEFEDCVNLAKYFLGTVGLLEDCTFRFSQWDPEDKEKYEGTVEQWNEAQDAMKVILDNLGIKYEIGVGEAAFYGPKLDIQYKNVYGKEDTLVTVQIDMLLAEKFGMYYIDEKGEKTLPYIIHRTSLGCYERTLAYMLEKYAGALPVWLAPVQVKVLSLTDRNQSYAKKVLDSLLAKGIRAELDDRSEKVGYKIREAHNQKIPYIVICGDEEESNGTISLRARGGVNESGLNVEEFANKVAAEILSRANN